MIAIIARTKIAIGLVPLLVVVEPVSEMDCGPYGCVISCGANAPEIKSSNREVSVVPVDPVCVPVSDPVPVVGAVPAGGASPVLAGAVVVMIALPGAFTGVDVTGIRGGATGFPNVPIVVAGVLAIGVLAPAVGAVAGFL